MRLHVINNYDLLVVDSMSTRTHAKFNHRETLDLFIPPTHHHGCNHGRPRIDRNSPAVNVNNVSVMLVLKVGR